VRSALVSDICIILQGTYFSGWDIHDTVYSPELLISNKENGYRDVLAKIDLTTYRRIPWEHNVPFFLVSFYDPDTQAPLCVCPRSTLAKALQHAEKYGWECFAGVEYEVNVYRIIVSIRGC
jgi:glutamine synthetase